MARKKKPFPPPADYAKPEPEAKAAAPQVAAAPAPEATKPPPGPEAHQRASAAAQEPPKAGAGAGAKPGEPPLGQTPEQAAAALVMMSEVAMRVGTKFYCARNKVKLTPELSSALKLSEAEKADLMTYAPYAAPFVWEMLLKYGKYIGAALYGLMLYDQVLNRFAIIKELGKVQKAQDAATAAEKGEPIKADATVEGKAPKKGGLKVAR